MSCKKIIAVFLSTVLAVLSCVALASDKPLSQRTEFLFIQNAKSGVVTAGKTPGQYVLTLEGVNPYMTYFSDRPSRVSGLISTGEFIKNWQKKGSSFAKDAPNAGFQGVKLNGVDNKTLHSVAVVLTDPQYNADNKTLVYTTKPLNNASLDLSKPIHYANVALFIDDSFLGGNMGEWCTTCS